MVYTLRPAGKYMFEAGLEDIHALTRHWKTDLQFYRDEIRFLMDLIGRYSALVMTQDHIALVKTLEKKLSDTETALNNLESKVDTHLGYVEDLMQGVMRISETLFRVDQAKLENEIMYFVNALRELKKEIFSASEELFKADEVKQLTGQK